MTADFEAMLARAKSLAPDQLPEFLGEVERIRAIAWSRLTTPSTVTPQAPDELLSVEAAAERLGVSKDYLYRNNAQLPFCRRMGPRLSKSW
jgi:hypothetical protein